MFVEINPYNIDQRLINQAVEIVKKGGNIEIDSHIETSDPLEVEDFFNEAKRRKLEGIMAKKPDSNYEADFIKKNAKKNKDIENVAIAFVAIIVLLHITL